MQLYGMIILHKICIVNCIIKQNMTQWDNKYNGKHKFWCFR